MKNHGIAVRSNKVVPFFNHQFFFFDVDNIARSRYDIAAIIDKVSAKFEPHIPVEQTLLILFKRLSAKDRVFGLQLAILKIV